MHFESFLATSSTLDEALRKYIDFLKETFEEQPLNMRLREKASAIQAYLNIINNQSLIDELYDIFDGLFLEISNSYPDMAFSINANIKSVQSFLEKVDMFEEQGKPLEAATKDILRFRITTEGPEVDNIESVHLLELTMLTTVSYFLRHNFMLSYPGKTKDLLEKKEYKRFKKKHPNIFIMDAKYTLIPEGYCSYFKNYVVNPKKNGYQRLHSVVSSADDGIRLEFQGETSAMASRSNGGLSNHTNYKEDRKKLILKPENYSHIGEVGIVTPKILFSKESMM